jgi:hypothetical protein
VWIVIKYDEQSQATQLSHLQPRSSLAVHQPASQPASHTHSTQHILERFYPELAVMGFNGSNGSSTAEQYFIYFVII